MDIQRTGDRARDLRTELLDPIALPAQYVADGAERHRQLDRVIERRPIGIGRSHRCSSISPKPALSNHPLTSSASAIENGPRSEVGSHPGASHRADKERTDMSKIDFTDSVAIITGAGFEAIASEPTSPDPIGPPTWSPRRSKPAGGSTC
jgi:hypothetical protein